MCFVEISNYMLDIRLYTIVFSTVGSKKKLSNPRCFEGKERKKKSERKRSFCTLLFHPHALSFLDVVRFLCLFCVGGRRRRVLGHFKNEGGELE